ncbi:hypothetical protein L596_011765 [Steinernema carpocapsae]|uniref:Uncharacterized protein n=1 Tax=Steinernema carpocapsae TaxID=34508 RepID=A0A4U5NVB3_STECR|nr:hypothetical protein L596_011765 [Steinernema carpocapsae]
MIGDHGSAEDGKPQIRGDLQVKHTYRVDHGRDGVEQKPVRNFEDYYHHGQKIWYNNNMEEANYAFCKDSKDSFCSDHDSIEIDVENCYYYNASKSVVDWG